MPPHGLIGAPDRSLPPHRLVGGGITRNDRRADEGLALIPERDLVARLRVVHVERECGGSAGTVRRLAGDRDAGRTDPLHVSVADAVNGIVERVPVGPRTLERFPGLNALPGHVEFENQAGEIAVGEIRKQRVPERIVLLKQDQDGEICHVAKHSGDGESGVGGAPQCGRRAVVIKTLQMQVSVRLEFANQLHFVYANPGELRGQPVRGAPSAARFSSVLLDPSRRDSAPCYNEQLRSS